MSSGTRNRFRLVVLAFIFSFVGTQLLGLLTTVASAQQSNENAGFNLVVSPLPLALTTTPGTSVSTDVKVMNNEANAERVKISVMKFGAEGEDGSPKLLDPEPSDEYLEWISFSEQTFTAQPGQWKTIKVTINPPKTAAFGYYYALVFARDNQKVEAQKANLFGAVAGLLLLDVDAPGAKRSADALSFESTQKVYEFLPASFKMRIKNTGNTHVAPRGNVFIKQGDNEAEILELNKNKGYILPGSVRAFDASWSNGSPVFITDDNGKKQLSWKNMSLDTFRVGKYTAEAVVVYNDGKIDVPVKGQVSFWVIPWRILGAVALVGILILAGVYVLVIRPIVGKMKAKKS